MTEEIEAVDQHTCGSTPQRAQLDSLPSAQWSHAATRGAPAPQHGEAMAEVEVYDEWMSGRLSGSKQA